MYHSIADIIRQSEEKSCPFWQIVLQADMEERGVSYETSFATMRHMYQAMKDADAGYDPTIHSASGMAGGAGEKLHVYNAKGANLCGGLVGQVMEKAIKMGESNACMHRIVAAPTAGSCGVIPAVFLVVEERLSLPEEKMVEAMFVSAGIGAVIAENASLAGASGGCQAEIGSASAMAAGGLAYLQGLFEKAKIREHQKAMASRVEKLVRPAKSMSELEKEKYVHDFICQNVRYDKLKKSYSHEIIGPLGQGVGVCEGIAKSVKVLSGCTWASGASLPSVRQ